MLYWKENKRYIGEKINDTLKRKKMIHWREKKMIHCAGKKDTLKRKKMIHWSGKKQHWRNCSDRKLKFSGGCTGSSSDGCAGSGGGGGGVNYHIW